MDEQDRIHWPELDEAIRKEEEERAKAWREVEAELFADELVEKLPLILQAQRVSDSILGHEAELYVLIQEWYQPVKGLLKRLAHARPTNHKDHFRELIIANEDHHSHALYWEAEGGAIMTACYFSIRLVTDATYQPLHFLVECRVDGNYLTVKPEIEALKGALLKAFKLGRVCSRDREGVAGVDIYRFLRDYQPE